MYSNLNKKIEHGNSSTHPRSKFGTANKVNKSLKNKDIDKLPSDKETHKGIKKNLKIDTSYKLPLITKYIKEKVESLNEGIGSAALGASQLLGNYGMAAMATTQLAGLAISAAQLIANASRNYMFDKKGCDGVVEPKSRSMCEQRAIDRLISGLRTQMNYCKNSQNPQQCENAINAEIQKQNTRKAQIIQSTLPNQ